MQHISDVKCRRTWLSRSGRAPAWKYGTCTFKTKAQPPADGAVKYAVVW